MSSVPIKIFCLTSFDDMNALADAPEIDKASTGDAIRALVSSLHSDDELIFADSVDVTIAGQYCSLQSDQDVIVRNISYDDAVPDLEVADFVIILAGDADSARFLKDQIETRGIGAMAIQNTGGLAGTIPLEEAFKFVFGEDELTYPVFFEKLIERIRAKKQP